jgi:hypothetical protein
MAGLLRRLRSALAKEWCVLPVSSQRSSRPDAAAMELMMSCRMARSW